MIIDKEIENEFLIHFNKWLYAIGPSSRFDFGNEHYQNIIKMGA